VAVTFLTGFESAASLVDGIALSGTAAYSTTQARTGTRSIRCNPASGASGYAVSTLSAATGWHHFGLFVASLPSVTRIIAGGPSGYNYISLKSDGYLEYHDYTGTLIGTSSVALSTATWYWIGWRSSTTGASVPLLQVDGTTALTAISADGGVVNFKVGLVGTEASAIDLYFDDIIDDNAGFLAPSKVALLLPISDNARTTLWTGGSGGTTNLYDAVNNTPPVGSATESDTTQIEHAGGAAGTTDAYDANMTTYTTAGVGASDTVIALRGVIAWGEDIATGTKLLSWSGVSNPSWTGESSIDVSTGHGSGAVGTYGTGTDYWNERQSAVVTSPSVTLGTSPVMRVVRPETASRVASVCFMGMYVAWTPPKYTTISSSFAANAVIKKTITPTFTANAANKKTQAATFYIGNNDGTGGAVLAIPSTTYTFTDKKADAVIKKTQTPTFAANAVIKKTASSTFIVAATIKRTQSGSFTANAVLKRTQAGTLTADAVIFKAGMAGSSTANAVLKRTQTGTLTAAATIKKTFATTTTANATIKAAIPGSTTANAVILANSGTKTFAAAAAILRNSGTKTFAAAAVLRRTFEPTFAANAVIKREQTGSFAANAVLKRTQNPTSTVDAIRKRTFYFGSGPDPR